MFLLVWLTQVYSIKDTGKPGKEGNYCVAAHRSRRYGHQFNRLGEISIGDEIIFHTETEIYTYLVKEINLVKASDADYLKARGRNKDITLITCDYRLKPTGRLLVTGELR